MDASVAAKKTDAVLSALSTMAQGKYSRNPGMLCAISYIDSKLRAYRETLADSNDGDLISAISGAAGSDSGTSGASASQASGTSTSSSSSSSSSTQSSGTKSDPKSCVGYLPSGAGVGYRPYTEITAGGDTNTSWSYALNGGRCTWYCQTGYAPDAQKSSCLKRGEGSGITVYVYDSNGTPLPGATVELIGSLGISTYAIATLTSDSNGKTPENFDEGGSVGNLLKVTKSGYAISYANGCSSRVTKGASYCDGIKMRDSVVKVYLSPVSSANSLPTCGSDWEKIGTFSCDSQNRQIQTIDSCLPPLYDNASFWTWKKNPDSFSHLTGKSCQ